MQIYEGGTENNTLASYDSCINDNVAAIGYTGDAAVFTYIANGFLSAATDRLNQYLVDGQYSLNDNDTYAMMNLCPFEYAAYGECQCGRDQPDVRVERFVLPVHRGRMGELRVHAGPGIREWHIGMLRPR